MKLLEIVLASSTSRRWSAACEYGICRSTPPRPTSGISPSAWWVRLTLRNEGAQPRLVPAPRLSTDRFAGSVRASAGFTWRQHATGDRRPFGSRDVAHRDFLFPLTVPAGTERRSICVMPRQGPSRHQPLVARSQHIDRGREPGQTAYGIYFGCVLMLLVWSGWFLRSAGPRLPGLLAYVATFGVYMAVDTSFAFQYFWPDGPGSATPV